MQKKEFYIDEILVVTLEFPRDTDQQSMIDALKEIDFKLTLELSDKLDSHLIFRGIDYKYLEDIVAKGVEITPAHNPIFAGTLDKACEYGWSRNTKSVFTLIAVYDINYLEKSHKTMPYPISEIQMQNMLTKYKSYTIYDDIIEFSMLPDNDPRRGKDYEYAYCYTIPKDQRKAIKAVLIVTNNFESINE